MRLGRVRFLLDTSSSRKKADFYSMHVIFNFFKESVVLKLIQLGKKQEELGVKPPLLHIERDQVRRCLVMVPPGPPTW